jgi:aminoglycoside 6'-N-acetyltransferase
LRQSGDIDLVAFDPEEHLPLLERWLPQPHVRRWWGDPETNIARARRCPPAGGHVLITAAATPVGYLCWQPYRREDLEILGGRDIPDGSIDVDIFIGDLAHVGRGVGPRALRLLLALLAADPSVPLVGMCTSVDNTRAVRAYEKAGFSRVREYDDPEWGRCWFMAVRLREVTAQHL